MLEPHQVFVLRLPGKSSTGSTSFEEGALLAVNLGDDADTTGAVYGQFAGAFYGESGIPSRWLAKVHARDLLAGVSDHLFRQAVRGN